MKKKSSKKYWLYILVLVLVSVFTAVVALLNNDTMNALYYNTGLFVFAAYAGVMTARFFYKLLFGKRRVKRIKLHKDYREVEYYK